MGLMKATVIESMYETHSLALRSHAAYMWMGHTPRTEGMFCTENLIG